LQVSRIDAIIEELEKKAAVRGLGPPRVKQGATIGRSNMRRRPALVLALASDALSIPGEMSEAAK
jgi:hypothetical protein